MVTMLGLRRRCGKQEVYKPVYSCPGESGHTVQSDLMYQNQPLNISYIDLYGHCNATKGDNHKPVVSVTKVNTFKFKGWPFMSCYGSAGSIKSLKGQIVTLIWHKLT